MRTICLVVGTHGEYSDRVEWFARAFVDKERAERYRERCEARALELAEWRDPEGDQWPYVDEDKRPANGVDPGFVMRSTCSSTDYYVAEVELDEVIAPAGPARAPDRTSP